MSYFWAEEPPWRGNGWTLEPSRRLSRQRAGRRRAALSANAAAAEKLQSLGGSARG